LFFAEYGNGGFAPSPLLLSPEGRTDVAG